MGNMLSSATSGLLAFQRALDTTSHNIANVNTEGYSRQRVQIGTRVPEAFSTGFIGSGVDVQTVERSYDDFIGVQARTTSSGLSRLNVYADQADGVNNLFSDADTGLTASLQKFINAFHDVADSPSSIPARQVVLSQAQAFTDRLSAYDQQLTNVGASLNDQLTGETTAINSLAKTIADLNYRITLDKARTGQPPNDLLDQRDHALDQLATHVNVDVTTQDNGSVIVAIGHGQPLVVGSDAATLVTQVDSYDTTRNSIVIQSSGVPVDITSRLSGGTLGGQLDFQREMLDPARNTLGRITIGLAELVNQQNSNGIDLNGAPGQDLIAVGGVEVLSRNTNTGTSAAAVTRQQPSAGALTDSDYILEYVGAAWSLRRADTGVAVPMAGAGTGASPFTANGISIVVSGTPSANDSHLIRPTRGAISGMQLTTQDPARIAAAAPIATAVSSNNLGSGRISAGTVRDITDPQLQTPATIQFVTATTYTINGGPAQAYTAGSNIDANGWRVQITGAPSINDTFSIGPNTNPAGDNRNALLLTDVLGQPVLDGGNTSLNSAAGRFIASIGVATGQARSTRDSQQAIYNDNVAARDAISGVNLDEEAANLIRYQQAYQAAAQVISIANTLFDSVLAATRR
jgi:flagellar hook-associated protein 1 FlgK